MLVFVTEIPGGGPPAASEAAGSTVVSEQEDVWESDIYPPAAWEGAAYYREQKSEPSSWRSHGCDSSVDTGGEVWESDLYSPEAWLSGVEEHDRNAPLSASNPAAASSGSASGKSSGKSSVSETHNEVFWPNIESYISRPSGSRPTPFCVICQISQLVIAGLQERDAGITQEEREVLSCGHVVGAECFQKWEAMATSPVKCPVCNAMVD